MKRYKELKEEILKAGRDFRTLFAEAAKAMPIPSGTFDPWHKTLDGIDRQIEDESFRVAVVGPIKSGKSTFVNSLFKGDYLKRGAGVVTSIVTRIHCGDTLAAELTFKSWDEINREISQAAELLPGIELKVGDAPFDLRKEAHRAELATVLEGLSRDLLITDDARNVHAVLLTLYLKGYERMEGLIGPDGVIRHFEGDDFASHRDYSGDEVLAVYLKDICLTIDTVSWDPSVEIADCQGSDSPNPLHLSMIQDYLVYADLLVYVISSRTGLRRADIRFLTMIREMGIAENTTFVVNCDFSEHESMENMESIVAKITEELSLLIPDPEVHTVSALYQLFTALETTLPRRDQMRLEQWRLEDAFSQASLSGMEGFTQALESKLTLQKYFIALNNHAERQMVIAGGVKQWITLNREMLSRDRDSASRLVSGLMHQQEKMAHVKTMIRSTLDGALKKVKGDISGTVDRFFDGSRGPLVADVTNHIRNYSPDYERYGTSEEEGAFIKAMGAVHRDFRQSVDRFLAEQVNPRIIGLSKELEETLRRDLDRITSPYGLMINDSLGDYRQAVESLGLMLGDQRSHSLPEMDMETARKMAGIHFPSVSTVLDYSLRVRAEAMLRFGAYHILNFVRQLLKKPGQGRPELCAKALTDGMNRTRKEAVDTLEQHLRTYKENLKFHYFYKLADALADQLFEYYAEGFHAYLGELDGLTHRIEETGNDKEAVLEALGEMEKGAMRLFRQVDQIKMMLE
ncbi:dynamin family protein [Desulfoluna sp.]|uniref:dynamin family protein n=1 Tax=Desulfoluna sp. TaxID=2045199 RepID=UPI002631E604|nr:dynamin family protein [Desulfoluna sp.]